MAGRRSEHSRSAVARGELAFEPVDLDALKAHYEGLGFEPTGFGDNVMALARELCIWKAAEKSCVAAWLCCRKEDVAWAARRFGGWR